MREAFSRVAMLLARILAYIYSTFVKLKRNPVQSKYNSNGGVINMTDLQIKYQQLQEEKRSNLANESIKRSDVESASELRSAQVLQVAQNIDKMVAEIDKIRTDTRLSEAQRAKAISEIVYGGVNSLAKISEQVMGWYKTLSKTQQAVDAIKGVAGKTGAATNNSSADASKLWSN